MTSPPRTPGGAPIRSDLEWRYLRPDSRVIHALQTNPLATNRRSWAAACGTSPAFGSDWYGTGNQTEYDTADRLRPCKRCLTKLGIPPNTTERTPS